MIDNPAEWFQTKLQELEREGTLEDMKSLVLNSEKSILRDIVLKTSVQPLFDALDKSNHHKIELICIVIDELLSQLQPKELLNVYGDRIHELLIHESHEAKRTALKLLEKIINEDSVHYLTTKEVRLITDAINCLASDERGTAQGAISIFIKLGKTKPGLHSLYSTPILNKMKEIMDVNDISRFRVYEIITTVSKSSPEGLQMAVSKGIMLSLVSELRSSDTLVQLNALEILSNLADSNHGLHYLLEQNVVQELAAKLLQINDEPLSLMLLPGLIEFFGNVFVQQPEQFAKEYPQVLALLFSSIENGDQILLGVIISTFGKIGSTCSGRNVLIQHSQHMQKFLKKITQFLAVKNDLAINVLNSLSELLKKLDGDEVCNEITEQWFQIMGTDALTTVVSLAKLPFAEFRLSAMSLLKSIAMHDWGMKMLYDFPGMTEYLLDRSTEFNKDCKQLKYDIVCNMVQCPSAEELIAKENLVRLNEFVRQGPYYVETHAEMAVEGVN